MGFIPQYTVTAHLLRLLEGISSLKTKIDLSTVSVAWIPKLTRESFIRTAHSSTAIEGNPLTLKEVQILTEGGRLPYAKPKHIKEIINYLAALQYIAQNKSKKQITKKDILKLHTIAGEEVLDRGPVGGYRGYQVYVGRHTSPSAKEVPLLINELLEWLNGKGQRLPAVFTSAILHYQFEFIHPFGDGNGRVGRLLAAWELFRKKFDTHHIFSVDEVFLENRQRYYAALDNVKQQKGDITGWLEFSAEAVELTLERVLARIELIKMQHKKEKTITLTPKQERLLNLLQNAPMSIQELKLQLKVTKQGAHFLLKPLIENKLVKRIGGHKTGKYTLM